MQISVARRDGRAPAWGPAFCASLSGRSGPAGANRFLDGRGFGGPVHPMSLMVDVKALRDANYDLNIEVTGPDGSVATATRRFKVGRR